MAEMIYADLVKKQQKDDKKDADDGNKPSVAPNRSSSIQSMFVAQYDKLRSSAAVSSSSSEKAPMLQSTNAKQQHRVQLDDDASTYITIAVPVEIRKLSDKWEGLLKTWKLDGVPRHAESFFTDRLGLIPLDPEKFSNEAETPGGQFTLFENVKMKCVVPPCKASFIDNFSSVTIWDCLDHITGADFVETDGRVKEIHEVTLPLCNGPNVKTHLAFSMVHNRWTNLVFDTVYITKENDKASDKGGFETGVNIFYFLFDNKGQFAYLIRVWDSDTTIKHEHLTVLESELPKHLRFLDTESHPHHHRVISTDPEIALATTDANILTKWWGKLKGKVKHYGGIGSGPATLLPYNQLTTGESKPPVGVSQFIDQLSSLLQPANLTTVKYITIQRSSKFTGGYDEKDQSCYVVSNGSNSAKCLIIKLNKPVNCKIGSSISVSIKDVNKQRPFPDVQATIVFSRDVAYTFDVEGYLGQSSKTLFIYAQARAARRTNATEVVIDEIVVIDLAASSSGDKQQPAFGSVSGKIPISSPAPPVDTTHNTTARPFGQQPWNTDNHWYPGKPAPAPTPAFDAPAPNPPKKK